jgi:phosphoenolpyruvate phosphomutase
MWLGSFTDSTLKGKPDTECVDVTSRLRTLNDILEITTKPIIYDGGTGGNIEQFSFLVRSLERLGVSAVVIGGNAPVKELCDKIREGKVAQITDDFIIVARCKANDENGMSKCAAYIEAGADAILVQSNSETPDETFAFIKRFRSEVSSNKSIVVMPTTFSQTTEAEIAAVGANIVIYANHLLLAAEMAMKKTAIHILNHERGR